MLSLPLFTLAACGTHPQAVVGVSSLLTNGQIGYAALARNVLQPKCVGCHNSRMPSGGIDLSTYASTMSSGTVMPGNPNASRLYTVVASGSMPKGEPMLSSDEIGAILTWIAQGAPETGPVPAPTPAPTPTASPTPAPSATPTPSPSASATPLAATFSNVSRTILQARCVACHSGSGASAGIDLSSYAAVMASGVVQAGSPQQSSLYTVTSSGVMPPSGPLQGSDTQLISDWITAGALNN